VSGYLIGALQKEPKKPAPEKQPTKHQEAVRKYPAKKRPTAMEILQHGFAEDAQENSMPDVSWYVPGETQNSTPNKKPPKSKPLVAVKSGKVPKLVIIIDDVSRKRQLDAIQRLPYHITPSIFPPSEISATSNQLAQYAKHYMVHLPMQSGSAEMNRMKGMLFTRISVEKMQARVDEIRKLFPKAKFVNNHTGSVFTSNYKAMKQLYGMLRKKGFVFVDSRTSAKSVVRSVAHDYHDTYITRDVFIDNIQTEAVILKQLKHAVRIAKKRGFAIAIGHPHAMTMQALRHAKKILEGVQVVYIDELYPKL